MDREINNVYIITETVSNKINQCMKVATVITSICFALIILVSVISRYIFRSPILFSIESSKLLFVWSCFFAATIAYKRREHIRFEFLNNILGKKVLLITDQIIDIGSIIFFVVLFVYSISFIKQIWPTVFPVMGISQAWLYVSLPIALIVMIIHSIVFFIHDFNFKNNIDKSKNGNDR